MTEDESRKPMNVSPEGTPDAQHEDPGSPASPPRARAMRHLRHILLSSTGAALGLMACESDEPLVCDPMPPPISVDCEAGVSTRLFLEAGMFSWEAFWTRDGDKLLVALVVQTLVSGPTPSFAGEPLVLQGGKVVQVLTLGNGREIRILTEPGATLVIGKIPLVCEGIPEELVFRGDRLLVDAGLGSGRDQARSQRRQQIVGLP